MGKESLCAWAQVNSYMDLKYGDPYDPEDMQEYEGEKTFEKFRDFVERLKPPCGPNHFEMCNDEQTRRIVEYQGLSSDVREQRIVEMDGTAARLKARIQEKVEEINRKQEEAMEKNGLNGVEAMEAEIEKEMQTFQDELTVEKQALQDAYPSMLKAVHVLAKQAELKHVEEL